MYYSNNSSNKNLILYSNHYNSSINDILLNWNIIKIKMKCQILILFLVVITTINSQEQKWQTQQIDYNGKPLKIVFFKGIDPQNILSIIGQVDKSTVSTNPNSAGASDAFIRPNDVILCSKKLLIWFSLASKQERKVRSGGGLVSGVWELLENEKTKELKLKRAT